jgi:hypothetical protein
MMMHKTIITLSILILNILCLAQFAGGTGTYEDPYLIETADQLNTIRNYKTSSFRQIADIDLGVPPWNEGSGWDPIGDYIWTDPTKSFRGNYDGGGYKISNMSIKYPTGINSAGLFASTEGCVIKNINLLNFDIRAYGGSFGGLIGYSYLDNISNVIVEGRLEGYSDMGLLAHFFEGYNITNCHAKGEIISTGGGWIGGLVANCNADSILNSSVEAKISSKSNFNGGLIALCVNAGIIDNCFTKCEITVTNGDWTGSFIGAILPGHRPFDLTNSFAIGSLKSDTSLDNRSFSGFVADASGRDGYPMTISNCYTTVNVEGNKWVGGLIGRMINYVNVEYCYSAGSVFGNTVTGGLVGYVEYPETITVTNSYWDMETAGVDSSAAGEGRTTAEMTLPYSENTYVGWDFVNIWRDDVIFQNNGYPTFQWVSGIENNEEDYIYLPKGFELFQNYPNPFNPITQIRFALSKTADVKLSVFNINGQKVADLANGVMNAGVHAVDFDGSKLNSGVYYYTLVTDGLAMTKKMVLTK